MLLVLLKAQNCVFLFSQGANLSLSLLVLLLLVLPWLWYHTLKKNLRRVV